MGLAFTLTLVAVFSLSASYKIANPDKIPELLGKLPVSHRMPEAIGRIVSGALIGIEAFIAAALIFRFSVKLALQGVVILSLLFSLLVAPFYEQLGGDCGCLWKWVPLAPQSGLHLIARNVCLALMAIYLLHRHPPRLRDVHQ